MIDGRPALLQTDALSAAYGRIEALKPTSLDIASGEVVVVLGPNGAGKSTLMRAIMGLIPCRGEIRFEGQSIAGWPTRRRANAGIALVPEGRGVLGPLSVIDNLELGAYCRQGRARNGGNSLAAAFELFPRLEQRSRQKAGSLSGGEQQMLAIGRALMARPRLLLLDEPSLGLAPRVIEEIFAALAALKRRGLSILLVEQKAPLALSLSERVYVLRSGAIVASMRSSEVTDAADLGRLYLGA
jgi:branched-chain amino acid transport system ATP-binding protein